MKQASLFLALALVAAAQHPLDEYNVAWFTPSQDSSGSMPLGNGDIGLNVWVEPSGDLVFYISKTDAWSETARLLKLGRVRVKLSPNPIAPGQRFVQRLSLRNAAITVSAGKPEEETRLRIWVDANYPVIRVEAESIKPIEMQVIYERWRDQQRLLEGDETHSAYGLDGGPEPLVSYGDSVLPDAENSVIWYHRNPKSVWAFTLRQQGLAEFANTAEDPLLNRTFGAGMRGPGFARINPTTLRSRTQAQKHLVNITALTATAPESETWIRQITQLMARFEAMGIDSSRAGHERWWNEFWSRSYLRITGGPQAKEISQAYALQRFINACAGRGAYPIKFNGSIFTVDAKVKDITYDADYRKWGGPYWFQNTRLIYWPMLASGDFDMMTPFFRMYRDALALAQRRTKAYFDHAGAFFPETMYFWGAYAPKDYGWDRANKPPSLVESTWIRHHHSGALELLALGLDYASYSNDRNFPRTVLAPLAEDIIEFYDKHYERDTDGRIKFSPAQSLETWQDVINPLPEIAGLKYVLNGLLSGKVPLSKQAVTSVRRILAHLPAVPTAEANGTKVLAPAGRVLGEIKNRENPELYAVFPYRLHGIDKPGIEIARAAFANRRFKASGGWQQDAIQAALLGLDDEARKAVVENFTAKTEQRFPAFWGPNFDWTPDQCHGNVAMLALQLMLLQPSGEKLLVAPAWPSDWTVEFKLWAPDNTVVEGVVKDGQIERLKLAPDKRMSDVVRPQAKT